MARILGLTLFLAGLMLTFAPAERLQAVGTTRKYPAGWALIAVPPGTDFSVAGTLYTMQPGDADYEVVQPGQPTTSGFGYWANFNVGDQSGYSRPFVLSDGSSAPYSVTVGAGEWVLVGDPSGILPASILGADAAYGYDALTGLKSVTTLQPGEGAWVTSNNGAVITVAPNQPVAAPPAAPPPVATAPPQVSASAGPAGPPLLAAESQVPNPGTSYGPASTWSWWPYPPPTLPLTVPPTGPSQPAANWTLCSGYIVTSFALDTCGSLLGEPVPGNGVPNTPAFPFIVTPTSAHIICTGSQRSRGLC